MTRVAVAAALSACAAAFVLSCGGSAAPKAEIRASVLPRAGAAAPTADDVDAAVTDVDLALQEMGIERREVVPLGGGRIRIVLPESLASRVPEVRARLADPKLGVRAD